MPHQLLTTGLLRILWVACLCMLAEITHAQITTTGDVNPGYDGVDPWVVDNFYIGGTAEGTLGIANGSVVNSSIAYVGNQVGSQGTVTVTGPESQWNNDDRLYVGILGTGTLTIEDGGTVTSESQSIGRGKDSQGTVNVFGTGSQWNQTGWLYVGEGGNGTLNVSSGGLLTTEVAEIGFFRGGQGTVTIDGAGSRWTSSDRLQIGYLGNGTLNIANQGEVNVGGYTKIGGSSGQPDPGSGAIDFAAGTLNTASLMASPHELLGSGTINTNGLLSDVDLVFDATTGLQSQLILDNLPNQNIVLNIDASIPANNTEVLGAGFRETGTLRIADGVAITSGGARLGYHRGSVGMATVTGVGSQWYSNRWVIVGNGGVGTLDVESGGVVTTTNTAYIGSQEGSQGTLTVTGVGSELNAASSTADILVGGYGHGTLNVTNGGVVDLPLGDTYVGADPLDYRGTGSGVIHLSGGTLNTAGLLASPDELRGTGIINTNTLVSDIDLVFDSTTGLEQQLLINSLPGQNVTLNIDAAVSENSGALGAGYRGTGTLRIADGLSVSGRGFIGYHTGSNGTATVTGENSHWQTTELLKVGVAGTGSLEIASGGSVSSDDVNVGDNVDSQGTVTVTGSGSEWATSGTLNIGNRGTGWLNIVGGGSANHSGTANIGGEFGGVGHVTVSGAASQWNVSLILFVGDQFSTGNLKIENGGVVDSRSNAIGYGGPIGPHGNGTAIVTGAGSQWIARNTLYVSNGVLRVESGGLVDAGLFSVGYWQEGLLQVVDGGMVISRDGVIGHQRYSNGTATVSGIGSQWISNDLAVGGRSVGTLYIHHGGTVSVSSDFGIRDFAFGQSHVNMATGGMLELVGDADASLAEFLDLVQGTDALRYWDHELMQWDDLTNATLGEDFTLEYFNSGDLAGYTRLTVGAISDITGLAGDFDNDGVVTDNDYSVWQAQYGATVPAYTAGDANGDGMVDLADYTVWRNNLGANGAEASSDSQVVPEPSTVSIMVMSLLILAQLPRTFK